MFHRYNELQHVLSRTIANYKASGDEKTVKFSFIEALQGIYEPKKKSDIGNRTIGIETEDSKPVHRL